MEMIKGCLLELHRSRCWEHLVEVEAAQLSSPTFREFLSVPIRQKISLELQKCREDPGTGLNLTTSYIVGG